MTTRKTRGSLAGRLSLVFAALLLACSAISVGLQIQAGTRHEQAVAQQLSAGLAGHIAGTTQLMDANGWRPDAVRELFDKLMAVNPSVEVYLLNNGGRIVGNATPPGHLKRERVDLAPIRRLLDGAPLPVLGDDPRNASLRKVFNAAPVLVDGRQAGYVYVILEGEDHDALAASLSEDGVLRTTLVITVLVAILGLVMGLIAFRLITKPLRALTEAVRGFDANGEQAAALGVERDDEGDEIAVLRGAFAQMGRRIAEQWRALARQDQERRDLIAGISHDLRTPLTSLHGYLETLRLKDEILSAAERQRYLDIALAQSGKVGRLARELFELARLESGLVRPELERFSLPELLQDVLQKFELAANARGHTLEADIPRETPPVMADLAMIERVLANLLDNAIRHTPHGTRIAVVLKTVTGGIEVEISDTGPGIPADLRESLFTRASPLKREDRDGGGLGLVIVSRILELHGSTVTLADETDKGAVFRFTLPASH